MDVTPEKYYVGMSFKVKKAGLPALIKQSVVHTYAIARYVGYTLTWLIQGKVSLSQMMGPIGIVDTIGTVVQQSKADIKELVINLFNITALISIALGATNLIPFPALDGSKLVILAVEGIRKKPIPVEKEAFISMIGFVILIVLAVFVFYNDILRIVGGG